MNSVNGCTTPSPTLYEPTNTPIGTAQTTESAKPTVTRKKLILMSVQSAASPKNARAADQTFAGEGRKTGFTNSWRLVHSQSKSAVRNVAAARLQYARDGMSRRSANHRTLRR